MANSLIKDYVEGEEIPFLCGKNVDVKKGKDDLVVAKVFSVSKNRYDKTTGKFEPITTVESDISIDGADKEVDAGVYRARWHTDKPHDYRFEVADSYVEYAAKHNMSNIKTTTRRSVTGVKQDIVLLNNSAPKILTWDVSTNQKFTVENRGFRFGDAGMMLFPTAYDADMNPVQITPKFKDGVLSYTTTVEAGHKYPITIDPTTEIEANNDGNLYYGGESVYLDARNSTTATGQNGTKWDIGQSLSGTYYMFRSWGKFAMPSMESISAASLYLYGDSDDSGTDFDVYIVSANDWSPPLSNDDFNDFDGWAASGAYTGTVLNATWNSSSWSSTWNEMAFNSDGRSYLLGKSGNDAKLCLLSDHDYDGTPAPTSQERVEFKTSAVADKEPYLEITYVAKTLLGHSIGVGMFTGVGNGIG